MLYHRAYRWLLWFVLFAIFCGCATYYRKTLQFQEYVVTGNFEKADQWLDKESKDKKGKNVLLYNLNRGYVSFMLQNYEASNHYFHTADLLIEDYIKNPANEALALLSNPTVKPYKPEDFEAVMLHYFTALNFVAMGKYSDALVECRRVNIKLNQLNDKYKDHKNRYQRDAFAHLLMGLIYEANRDYNNAFIAYRNAAEIYEQDYAKNFGVHIPQQLKQDILRTAYLTGFFDEVRFYEKIFSMNYTHTPVTNPEVIVFWLNGFGPIKHEWSINFTQLPGNTGFITLVNPDLGLNFPFYIGDRPAHERSAFSQFSMLRVAFPKYVERPPLFTSASIEGIKENYSLQMVENINDIAFKTLHDRMLRELSNSLLRLFTKKALEYAVRQQNSNLGAAVSIANALTEKADTRNWQTLPYSISYCRIPAREGINELSLTLHGHNNSKKTHKIRVNCGKSGLYFYSFHSLEMR